MFATAENKAVYDDMLPTSLGGDAANDDAGPPGGLTAHDRQSHSSEPTSNSKSSNCEPFQPPATGAGSSGSAWCAKKHTGRRYFARVRGGVHTAASVELEVPSHHVGKLQTLFKSEVTVWDGDNKWRLEAH